MKQLFFSALIIACALFSTSNAAEIRVGDIIITNPQIRATPKNAPVSGGYLVIHNTGKKADRLISAEAEFSGKVELHSMEMVGDVMKMRPIQGGLEIPPGEKAVLKRGGNHIMFMMLSEQISGDAPYLVHLNFEQAGKISVEFFVSP